MRSYNTTRLSSEKYSTASPDQSKTFADPMVVGAAETANTNNGMVFPQTPWIANPTSLFTGRV
jgi:hypothetical protein